MLEFNPTKLSRTMTRAEWRESYRWLRTARREVAKHLPNVQALDRQLANFAVFGTMVHRIKERTP